MCILNVKPALSYSHFLRVRKKQTHISLLFSYTFHLSSDLHISTIIVYIYIHILTPKVRKFSCLRFYSTMNGNLVHLFW